MPLIKLTALSHPELNEGKSWPVYIDASRVLLITRSSHSFPKLGAEDLKREVYDDLWAAMRRYEKLLTVKMPNEIDTQDAMKWAKEMHMVSHEIQGAYQAWGQAYRTQDFHPRVNCTEVQLACGTALEHGVMLTRVSVTETPEEVFELVSGRRRDPNPEIPRRPVEFDRGEPFI